MGPAVGLGSASSVVSCGRIGSHGLGGPVGARPVAWPRQGRVSQVRVKGGVRVKSRPAVTGGALDTRASSLGARLGDRLSGFPVTQALVPLALGGGLAWGLAPPAGVAQAAWNTLALFVATIGAIVAAPLPVGACALLGLTAGVITGVVPFDTAFGAFASDIPVLILMASFIARAMVNTGLGLRLALHVVRAFGGTALGLAYSLAIVELCLAPCIPSVAGRAGGIILPIILSLSQASGSDPAEGTEKRLGGFLVLALFQTSAVSCGMFLTGNHPNPLAASLAAPFLPPGQGLTWGTWALAALGPGLACLLTAPLVVYALHPPELKVSPEAPTLARARLQQMGPMSGGEKTMLAILLSTVALWIAGDKVLGVTAAAAAVASACALLCTGILDWSRDCVGGPTKAGWDMYFWFAALIAMAGQLKASGLVGWFADSVTAALASSGLLSLGWPAVLGALVLVYFYSHYFFASNAAHVGALYSAFLSVAVAAGCPPLVSAVVFAALSNQMGAITHFGMSSAVQFYGAGYVPLNTWWTVGLAVSLVSLALWATVGPLWWTLLGLI